MARTIGPSRSSQAYADRRVRVLALPRVGKADALTAAVAAADGEILVFTDANTHVRARRGRALVAPFADPEVGGVAGDQRYLPAQATGAEEDAAGERSYWDFDRQLKLAESEAGNIGRGDGRDLRHPTRRCSAGPGRRHRRLHHLDRRSSPRAAGWSSRATPSPASPSRHRTGGDEFGRKVRIMTRGLRGSPPGGRCSTRVGRASMRSSSDGTRSSGG